MALSHVELYEALKNRIGEKAAALIAQVVPPAADLATKSDIRELSAQVRTIRWMLGILFLPLWAGTWATFLAIVLKH